MQSALQLLYAQYTQQSMGPSTVLHGTVVPHDVDLLKSLPGPLLVSAHEHWMLSTLMTGFGVVLL
jgi:hypothetical protein